MSGFYAVFRRFGAEWVQGAPADAQPEWEAHAEFMNDLNERGIVVMAGPLEGTQTALVIVRAGSQAEAEAVLARDPWSLRDILPVESVRKWDVRVGQDEAET